MISLIVAFDQNQLIGKDNQMPWHYPADLKYFKEVTMGKPMLMGRNTFESLLSYGGPLKGRHHYVLTRQKDYIYDHPEVTMIQEWKSLLERYRQSEEDLFVIGGAKIYELLLQEVDFLYITHIERTYQGDTYFPPIDWNQFECIKENRVEGQPLRFCIYQKKTD